MESRETQPTPNNLLNLAIQAQTSHPIVPALPSVPTTNHPAEDPHVATIQNLNDRKWLEEALSTAFGRSGALDPTKRIIHLVRELKQEGLNETQLVEMLDELLLLTEQIDYSNDFEKVGGFPLLHTLLSTSYPSVRAKAAELFSQLMENNPYCQEKALESGRFLPRLLDMVEHDEDILVRSQALLGISSLIRSNPLAQAKFLKLDGLSILLRSMTETDSEKFQKRAAFMLSCVCGDNMGFNERVGNMGLAQHFIALLQGEHKQHHEHLMEALAVILQNSDSARKDAMRTDLGLADFLRERRKQLSGTDQYTEEYEAAGRILDVLGERHDGLEDLM